MILDTNVWCGRWHSRKLSFNTPDKLEQHLRTSGITRAVISTADAVFVGDPQPWNDDLSRSLSGRESFFIHAPVINPTLAHWDDVLTAYAADPARAVRLLPGCHGYSINSSELLPFFRMCSRLGFTVLIQMRMEDERDQHRLVQVPPVGTEEIIELAGGFPDTDFLCLSACFSEAVALSSGVENLYVDISFTEKMNTVAELIARVPVSQVVFGSHSPFFYTEGALLKMKHAEVSREDKNLIMVGNALRILAGDRS